MIGDRRGGRRRLFLLVQAAAALLRCEVAVRVLTTTNPDNGMAMIGRYALVPYRPAAEVVRASLARPGSYLVRDAELGWTVRPPGVLEADTVAVRERVGAAPTSR